MFTVGESKMTNVIFSYCITTYRAMTNALSYAIKRVQLSYDLKLHSSEEPTKNCTVAKCEVSWADSTVHDVRGYIGCLWPESWGWHEISHQASSTGRYAHIVLQGDAIKVCPVYGKIFHMYYNKYFSSLVTDYLRAYAMHRMKIK